MDLKSAITSIFIGVFLLVFTTRNYGQENLTSTSKTQIKVRKHTVLGQYEPEMVISAEERTQLKAERIATIRKRKEMIDTLDISDRKRRQLLKELYSSPFSYKWEKVFANIEAEDEPEEEH